MNDNDQTIAHNSSNQNASPCPALSNRNASSNSTNAAPADLLSPSQINITNLPKLISQLANTPGLPDLSALPPQEAIRTLQQALQLTRQVKQRSVGQQMQRQASSNSPMPSTPIQNHGTFKESPSTSSLHTRQYSSKSLK